MDIKNSLYRVNPHKFAIFSTVKVDIGPKQPFNILLK